MDAQKYNNDIDYYSANRDAFDGRHLNQDHEIVNYNKHSSIRVWFNQQTDSYNTHWHHAIEIIMPVENCYYATVNQEQICIKEGDLLFIPPGELHETPPPPDGGTRFIFLFDISMLSSLNSFSGIKPLLSTPLYISKETHPYIYEDIYNLLVQIRNDYFCDNIYNELTIYAHILHIFAKLGANYSNTYDLFPNSQFNKQHEYITKFNNLLTYIDVHYMEPLTLEDMAAKIGFSKFHFSRLFKQYTNYTFCDYLNYRRIKAAEDYLLRPDMAVIDVAMQVGFSSISTFNRLFREYKKCSPSEYRAKNSAILFNKNSQK